MTNTYDVTIDHHDGEIEEARVSAGTSNGAAIQAIRRTFSRVPVLKILKNRHTSRFIPMSGFKNPDCLGEIIVVERKEDR